MSFLCLFHPQRPCNIRPPVFLALLAFLFFGACSLRVSSGFATGSSAPAFNFQLSTKKTSLDEEAVIIKEQLGYVPTNFVRVSAWTKETRQPIAIQTYPLQGGSWRRQKRAKLDSEKDEEPSNSSSIRSPFPTLYWLTNPEISRSLAILEGMGCIQEFDAELNSNPKLIERLWRCHRQYAERRWEALSKQDRDLLQDASDPVRVSMRGIMRDSGISGSNLTLTKDALAFPAIKCLHAHYAQYRSLEDIQGLEINPLGQMIHEQLRQKFPCLEL